MFLEINIMNDFGKLGPFGTDRRYKKMCRFDI